jgi:hypothetical protein
MACIINGQVVRSLNTYMTITLLGTHTHTHTHTHTERERETHTRSRARAHTHTHTHTNIYIYIYIYIKRGANDVCGTMVMSIYSSQNFVCNVFRTQVCLFHWHFESLLARCHKGWQILLPEQQNNLNSTQKYLIVLLQNETYDCTATLMRCTIGLILITSRLCLLLEN